MAFVTLTVVQRGRLPFVCRAPFTSSLSFVGGKLWTCGMIINGLLKGWDGGLRQAGLGIRRSSRYLLFTLPRLFFDTTFLVVLLLVCRL